MGIFDFLKHDKKKAQDAGEQMKEQVQQQMPATDTPTGGPSGAPGETRYADGAAQATKEAAERLAAQAPPKPAAPPPMAQAAKPAAQHPAAPAAKPAMAAQQSAAPKPAPAAKKRTYTVKPGDSLSAISRRELGNEGRWRELYAMNRGVIGSNPDLIHPGMVLTLPN